MAIITIGRTVLYRSRTGGYTVPAIITATQDTLGAEGVEKGHVPPLTDPTHVHLTVFSPGKPGLRLDAQDFVGRPDAPIAENVGGSYQEWDVPPAAVVPVGIGGSTDVVRLHATISGDHPEDPCSHPPGTWAFPAREF